MEVRCILLVFASLLCIRSAHAQGHGAHSVLQAPRDQLPAIARAAGPVTALPQAPAAGSEAQVDTGGAHPIAAGLPGAHVHGAAGSHQYVQVADGMLAVFRKATLKQELAPLAISALYANGREPGLDACGAPHAGHASVLFDHLARRWILAHLATLEGRAYQCLAVSHTDNAAGKYFRYAIGLHAWAGAARVHVRDAVIGLWYDALLASYTTFDPVTQAYQGTRVCALERRALLRGRHTQMRCHDLGPAFGAAVPATLEAGAPPRASALPALFVALDSDLPDAGEQLVLWRYDTQRNRLSAPLGIPVAPFRNPCPNASCIAQPSDGALLPSHADRLAPRVSYTAGPGHTALLLNHTVRHGDGGVGLRWYEIRAPHGKVQVYQQGTVAPDHVQRWLGAIGTDKAGNIALAYAAAAADTAPGVRYTGRSAHDAPGRMQREEVLANGSGVAVDGAGPEAGALSLDPGDACTFWYTQRYIPVTGTAPWRSTIAAFRFRSCR